MNLSDKGTTATHPSDVWLLPFRLQLSHLAGKRVGLFICAGSKEQAPEELRTAFPEDLRNAAVASEVFGDEIYYDKLSLMDKFIMRMVKGKEKSSSGLSLETIEKFAHFMTKGS